MPKIRSNLRSGNGVGAAEIAQALDENLTLVSNEAVFDGFGVTRLW